MMSLSSTARAVDSSVSSTRGKESNLWDHNLDITGPRGLFNLSEEPTTITHCTLTKQNASQDTIEQGTEDALNQEKSRIIKPTLDELTEIKFAVDDNKDDNIVVKQESTSKRRSLSDLVERYKRVLEAGNCAEIKFQKEYTKHETE